MTTDKILGLGNDIIEIARIHDSLESHGSRMLDRLFTKKEQAYCTKFQDPLPHYAGRFAAKEAIVKALGTGFGEEIAWLDIEITNDEKGKPIVEFAKLEKTKVLLSISHCRTYATAVAIWVGS